jgi:hypothetical protein
LNISLHASYELRKVPCGQLIISLRERRPLLAFRPSGGCKQTGFKSYSIFPLLASAARHLRSCWSSVYFLMARYNHRI